MLCLEGADIHSSFIKVSPPGRPDTKDTEERISGGTNLKKKNINRTELPYPLERWGGAHAEPEILMSRGGRGSRRKPAIDCRH